MSRTLPSSRDRRAKWIGLAQLDWPSLPTRTAPKELAASCSFKERITLYEATHLVGWLSGSNDSSCMEPVFQPSSITPRRAMLAPAGRFARIKLQLLTANACGRSCLCESMCVYTRARMVRDVQLALLGVSLAQDLNMEQLPVMDIPLAETAESAVH